MQRYFIHQSQPTIHETVILPKEIAHHFITVLRAQIGAECELVFSNEHVYLAALVNAQMARVEIIKDMHQNAELPIYSILACGLPKTKDKPELIVQKATELGADEIIFFESKRSVSHWTGAKQGKKLARLQKIANGAAEQSHRNRIPKVTYLPNLAALLAQTDADHKIVAWEESAKQGETSALATVMHQVNSGDRLLAIFGPEGGLTESEIEKMVAEGVVPVGLGPRILRAETAPLYLLGAISFALELS
ncbi:16S rRNA (uracil(1498)-N(3))-methyltransferase [uncultured Limosilactobacillus sp.]|uniref:16S rRNA (uracil(1498)-N(3))-methyltransferase n=1 Tax=uncultured Limosilactobacillus sp. TaxID=2837629 RepID=UPI0025F0AFCA|nr:16S rRNA (uracil(1498)-N(3))-methyltransferase [uncultured Limosilactobacillus sp.]